MSATIRYPYDPVGDKAECKVVGERFALSSINNSYRCIIPDFAPFYRNGLELVSWPSGLPLVEGKHYELVMKYTEWREVAANPLFGGIRFMDTDIGGEIELKSYQTVGANFTRGGKELLTMLVNLMLSPATVTWENVINKFDEYPAMAHSQEWHDFINKEAIATSVDKITSAVQLHANEVKTESVDYLNARITQLDTLLTNTQFDKHIINMANPHGVTAADVNALAKTAAVRDSFKLYAMTLKELADYINSRGITQAQLDAYLSKYDDGIISNRLILKDGTAKIVNGNSTSQINLANGDITYTATGTIQLGADRMRNKAGRTARWQSGKNVLKAVSEAGAYSKDNLTFNDKVVIHLGNIKKHLKSVDFGTIYLTTGSTTSATMTGDGRETDPLRVDVKYPAATNEVKGIGIVATVYGNSTTSFIAAKLLAGLVSDLSGYVPTSRRINGKSLTGDVVLTPGEVALGKVDNTNDLEKPISHYQQFELNRYSDKVHTHTLEQMSLPIATERERGIAYRYSTAIGDYDGVVTPSLLKQIYDALEAQLGLISNAIDMDALPVISLSNEATVEPVNPTPPADAPDEVRWSVLISGAHILYVNRTQYVNFVQAVDLSQVVPVGVSPANKRYYVYAQPDSASTFTYVISDVWLATTESRLFAGEFVSSANGPGTHTLGQHQSFGMFKELIEHINDPQAHLHDADVKGEFGLGLVENFPMVHTVQPLSAWAITNTWREAIPDALSSGWFKGIDYKTNSVLVNTTGLTLDGSAGWPLLCDDINMWEHVGSETDIPFWLGDWSDVKTSSVTISGNWSGRTLNARADAAINWLDVIIGTSKEASGRNVQLNCRGKLYSELAGQKLAKVELWDVRANDVTQLMQNSPIDPMQIRGNLEEMDGKTPFRIKVYWSINKTTGLRSILVSIELGEWRDVADVTTILIRESDLGGNAERIAAFRSGKVGLAVRNHCVGDFSVTPKLLVDKKQYASANLLIEALARGSGVVSLSGQTSGNVIPMPAGCSRALVMASLAEWVGDAGYFMNSVTTKVWWKDGNSNGGVPAEEPVRFPTTNSTWQQLTGQVESKNGTGSKLTAGLKYNYLVIGFCDPVTAKLID